MAPGRLTLRSLSVSLALVWVCFTYPLLRGWVFRAARPAA